MLKNLKPKPILLLIAAIIAIIVDRYFFALIAQWREDQGAAIYLGYHYFELKTPIGLLNTTGIPNPNGHILIAAILAWLPGLIWISAVIGLIQACASIFWIYHASKPIRYLFVPMVLPLLSSTILRVDGAEFWAQNLFETINIMFVGFVTAYIITRSVFWLVCAIFLMLFAPTIYIAGVADAINFFLVIFLVLFVFFNKKEFFFLKKKHVFIVMLTSVLLLFWEAYVTWIPYFHNASLNQFTFINNRSLSEKFHIGYEAMRYIPRGLMYLSSLERPINYIDNQYSLSDLTKGLLFLSSLIVKFQTVFFLLILLLVSLNGFWKQILYCQRLILTFPFLNIVGVFVFTAFLGGFSLHLGQRPDMLYRIYPLYLFLVFSGCQYFSKFLGMIQFRICLTSVLFFSFINGVAGISFLYDTLSNKSPIVEANDVPVIQKVQALDLVAKSWKSSSLSLAVPLDYDLDGVWTLPKTYFEDYYPGIYTTGIALDYELERKYGLYNYYRGITYRPETGAKYVIGFNLTCGCSSENICEIVSFGRVCVKIFANGKTTK